MKKYIKPITKEINVDLSQMIAASQIGVGEGSVDAGGSASKEFDGMNDDWNNDYEEE